MLHDVQIVIPAATRGCGVTSLQAQCQFQTIVVVPGGRTGTAGVESGSQFHVQFQTKVWEGEI
jgi:hypothetical protein